MERFYYAGLVGLMTVLLGAAVYAQQVPRAAVFVYNEGHFDEQATNALAKALYECSKIEVVELTVPPLATCLDQIAWLKDKNNRTKLGITAYAAICSQNEKAELRCSAVFGSSAPPSCTDGSMNTWVVMGIYSNNSSSTPAFGMDVPFSAENINLRENICRSLGAPLMDGVTAARPERLEANFTFVKPLPKDYPTDPHELENVLGLDMSCLGSLIHMTRQYGPIVAKYEIPAIKLGCKAKRTGDDITWNVTAYDPGTDNMLEQKSFDFKMSQPDSMDPGMVVKELIESWLNELVKGARVKSGN